MRYPFTGASNTILRVTGPAGSATAFTGGAMGAETSTSFSGAAAIMPTGAAAMASTDRATRAPVWPKRMTYGRTAGGTRRILKRLILSASSARGAVRRARETRTQAARWTLADGRTWPSFAISPGHEWGAPRATRRR